MQDLNTHLLFVTFPIGTSDQVEQTAVSGLCQLSQTDRLEEIAFFDWLRRVCWQFSLAQVECMSTALSVVSSGGRSAGLSHMGALTLEREDGEII